MQKSTIFLIVFMAFLSIGCAGIWLANNPVEEKIEERLEKGAEGLFNLPDGSLEGKINLSPNTPEDRK